MDSLFKQYEGIFKEKPEESKKEKGGFEYAFNPFALQDAIGEKNVKKIWIEYQKLRFSGIAAEEIIHKIISKAKDMLAISFGADMDDLGIKNAYPFNKSKKDSKNWSKSELIAFYTKMIKSYHRSRLESGYELDLALEKILLSI